MTFWDSSALLALLMGEPGAAILVGLMDVDPNVVMWWGTPVELVSGVCRVRRETGFDGAAMSSIMERIDRHAAKSEQVDPSEQVRRAAMRVLRVHDLRAGDAFQLAAALIWADHNPNCARFVCLDKRLREAAEREGFAVLPHIV